METYKRTHLMPPLIAYKAGVSRHNNITADKTTPRSCASFNNAASLDTQPTLRFIAPNIDSSTVTTIFFEGNRVYATPMLGRYCTVSAPYVCAYEKRRKPLRLPPL